MLGFIVARYVVAIGCTGYFVASSMRVFQGLSAGKIVQPPSDAIVPPETVPPPLPLPPPPELLGPPEPLDELPVAGVQ
jgi:hypothetical protein